MSSAFKTYLRTGRWPTKPPPLEIKFNPWHDPDDGRFTFAGRGRYVSGPTAAQKRESDNGFNGGGGGFGGGGSGASWGSQRPSGASRVGGRSAGGGATGSWRPPSPSMDRAAPSASAPRRQAGQSVPAPREPRLTVRKNGLEYSIDAHARTRRVSGEIKLLPQPRSRSAQANAGKPDRRRTDDGGHYIAARFNGPRDVFNHFAQDANFNRGAYRAIGDRWASAVRAGKRVFVDIVPHYRGASMRPYLLSITWTEGGAKFRRRLPNEKGGR